MLGSLCLCGKSPTDWATSLNPRSPLNNIVCLLSLYLEQRQRIGKTNGRSIWTYCDGGLITTVKSTIEMAQEPSQKLAGTVLLLGSGSSPPLRLNWLAGNGPQEFGSSETHFSPSGILKERCVFILFCFVCFVLRFTNFWLLNSRSLSEQDVGP